MVLTSLWMHMSSCAKLEFVYQVSMRKLLPVAISAVSIGEGLRRCLVVRPEL